MRTLADWTRAHGWFGYWLPGFLSGMATAGIIALLIYGVQP